MKDNPFLEKKPPESARKQRLQPELDKLWVEMQEQLKAGKEARDVVFETMWKTGAIYLTEIPPELAPTEH